MTTYFQDIYIDQIGNLLDFRKMNINELITKLSLIDYLAVFSVKTPTPSHWPKEIMQFENNANQSLNKWYMNMNGSEWILFYCFDVASFVKFNSYPAFIYKRETVDLNLMSYIPIIGLSINDNDEIIQANTTDKMVESALNPPSCRFSSDEE